eukprot:m.130841 g.130841  ORF g.130841 m.130841 type:complete len:153 (-) comp52359_c0_seq16:104-562(-)
MLARTPALVSARCALCLQVQAIGSSLSLSPCTSKAIFNNAHLQATCDTKMAKKTLCCCDASCAPPVTPAPPTGLLITVQRHDGSKIDGAWIIFPGNQLFETDVNGEFLYSNGMTGTFDIDVQADGFIPMTVSVTVTNTELATLTLTLAPSGR